MDAISPLSLLTSTASSSPSTSTSGSSGTSAISSAAAALLAPAAAKNATAQVAVNALLGSTTSDEGSGSWGTDMFSEAALYQVLGSMTFSNPSQALALLGVQTPTTGATDSTEATSSTGATDAVDSADSADSASA